MRVGENALAWMLVGLAMYAGTSAVFAVTAENPYMDNITNRNAFALKAPPPPPDPAELNKPKPSKIELRGIMTILGKKQALMKAPPLPPTKPGEQPKEQSYILAEGQRDGEVEVLQIDEKASTVKISNAGSIETLTFPTNIVASVTPTGPTGIPLPGGQMRPAPLGSPFTPSYEGMKTIPRTLRLPSPGATPSAGMGGLPMPTMSAGTVGGAVNAGGVALPAFGSGYQSRTTTQPQSAASGLTPEEQEAAIAVMKARDPSMAGLYPTRTGASPNANPTVANPNAGTGGAGSVPSPVPSPFAPRPGVPPTPAAQ